ncbi:hypothetical protein CATYP_03855 [Corynebacterium atypicum]|uniref:Holo-[acyl-carrier-protein] synthase n=1 Tax=Corynebacterium atypicum TaxID=191610 RepID=A0ABM5QMB2_9CORY|nr:holo-ACP synthase [Corynebacterium atypicum]AIG63929.1 hypothetical protein CATYP_03855 [Corynebacterium atypicum]
MLGLGVDLVEVSGFAAQLASPGTRFARSFSAAEARLAARRAQSTGQPEAMHLAARWAGKEAFIKAWSNALLGRAPVLDHVDLAEVEVLSDAYQRPLIELSGAVRKAFAGSVPGADIRVSLSHDGGYALAQVIVTAEPA